MKNELNPNAQAWVAALRSGNYSQTKGPLRRTKNDVDSYCCFGVACILYSNSVGGEWATDRARPPWDDQIGFTDDDGTFKEFDLSASVMDWLGLATPNGSYCDAEGHLLDLVEINDQYGHTFKQIAAVIESQPEGLFCVN